MLLFVFLLRLLYFLFLLTSVLDLVYLFSPFAFPLFHFVFFLLPPRHSPHPFVVSHTTTSLSSFFFNSFCSNFSFHFLLLNFLFLFLLLFHLVLVITLFISILFLFLYLLLPSNYVLDTVN